MTHPPTRPLMTRPSSRLKVEKNVYTVLANSNPLPEHKYFINKTKDWALVQTTALVLEG